MMNLWNESEVMEVDGTLFLNREATRKFLNVYGDILKFPSNVNYNYMLIEYDYATKVVAKCPVRSSNYSLNDFLGNNIAPVMDYNSSDVPTYDSSEKQLPVPVPKKDFINVSVPELQYTDDELKVINYFKKEGKVELNKIPQILKGQGFTPDQLVEYGYLLSKALPWYKFTSSDEQELRDKAIKARILKHDLPSIIKSSKDLSDVIAVLKAYKKYGDHTCSEDDLIGAINDFLINVIDETELKNFWDSLSNDEVFEGLYLKSYFGKLYPFKKFKDNEVIDVEISDVPDDNSKGIQASTSAVTEDDIMDFVNSSGVDDIISLDDDIKEQIAKCINFGNPYHQLLKIYQNSDSSKWDKYDGYVIEVIKDKVDYLLEIDSKDAYQLHVRRIGLILTDIHRLSITLKSDTFWCVADSFDSLTEDELNDLASKYSIGIGDPIHDLGLKKNESNKEDDNDSFTIKRRRKPKTKADIKKFVFAALAGSGIISLLYLTIVHRHDPINVIKDCVSTFKALFKGNSTLAELGASMGNLTAYFGSAIVTISSGLKLGKIIGQEDDNEAINQNDSIDSNSSVEEIESLNSSSLDLDDLVFEDSNTDSLNSNDSSSLEDSIEFSEAEFSEFIEADNTDDVKKR